MRRFSLSLVLLAIAACSQAEPPKPVHPAAAPAPAAIGPVAAPAPTPVKRTKMEFSIPLEPYKQADLQFGMFKNRWTLVFYFSPTCGHCQHTYPHIQQIAKTYGKKGLSVVAIASGYATPEDVRLFDADFKLDIPAFTDAQKQFGDAYGTGSVPLMLLVKPDGTFQTWNRSDSVTIADLENAVRAGLKVK